MDFDVLMEIFDHHFEYFLFLEAEHGDDVVVTKTLHALQDLREDVINRYYDCLRDNALKRYCKRSVNHEDLRW